MYNFCLPSVIVATVCIMFPGFSKRLGLIESKNIACAMFITVPIEFITAPIEFITVPIEFITVSIEFITVPIEFITVPIEFRARA